MTSEDRELVEWLATKVMGWQDGRRYVGTAGGYIPIWVNMDGVCQCTVDAWDPLQPGMQIWQLWNEFQRTAEQSIKLEQMLLPRWGVSSRPLFTGADFGPLKVYDSGPRALCEAIAAATGYVRKV